MSDLDAEYLKAALAAETQMVVARRAIEERAGLIVQMLSTDNAAAHRQAREAIERALRAEEALAVIRDLPSEQDLQTNALARAMAYIATGPGYNDIEFLEKPTPTIHNTEPWSG